MRLNTPLITLLGGAAVGVGVLVASMLQPSGTASASSGATAPAQATTSVTVPLTSSAPATAPATTSTTAPATTPAPASASAPSTGPAAVPTATPSAPQSSAPPKADYVGRVEGGGAAVAISVHKGKAVAYICDGHAVAAWYRGTSGGRKLDLTGKNGNRLSLNYRSGKAEGFVMADGVRYNFSVSLVHPRTGVSRPPGLYEATAVVKGVAIKAGWIVLPDGSQIGSVEYDPNSDIPPTAQAPVLNLTTGTAQYDGVTLVASLISGLTGSGF
jgi:hypothetical protein